MKNFILTAFILFTVFTINAQSGKLKKADKYYSKIAFHQAAELYKDLIGSEVDSPQLKAKLADCYFQMGETELAEKYYSEMVNSDQVENKDVYQTLNSFEQKSSAIILSHHGKIINLHKQLQLSDDYFADRSHLNNKGSKESAKAIAKFIDSSE